MRRAAAVWAVLTLLCAANPAAQSIQEEIRRFRVYPHLDRAYRLISQHKLEDAKIELQACLALESQDVAIWSTYLDVLYQMKDYEGIVAAWSDLGGLEADPRMRRYHLLAEVERSDAGAVLDDLRALAAIHSEEQQGGLTNAELRQVVARLVVLGRDRRQPEILRAIPTVVPMERLPGAALYDIGAAFRAMGLDADAGAAFEQAGVKADVGALRLSAYRELASLAVERKEWPRAWEWLNRIHRLQPADVSVFRSFGDVAAAQRNWREAVKWYRQWLAGSRLAPIDERYRVAITIGNAEFQLGRYRPAVESFAVAIRLKHNDVTALLAAARALELTGRTTAAVRNLRVALKVTPTADLNAAIGLLYSKMGEYAAGLPYLERARDLRASDSLAPSVLGQLGYSYAALDRMADARRSFETALLAAPDESALHAALGRVCAALHDPASAIGHFERSLALHDEPDVRQALGLTYAELGDDGGVGRVTERLPADSPYWRQLAETMFERGHFHEAAGLFRRAAVSSSSSRSTRSAGTRPESRERDLARAADSLERAGELAEASGILKEVASSPDAATEFRATCAERAGYLEDRLGLTSEAVQSFQLAIDLGHDAWRLHLDRALALSKIGRWEEALDESLASLRVHEGARARIAAAICFKALDKPDMAVLHFVASLDDADNELEPADRKYVLDELTNLYGAEGKNDSARAAAKRSLSIVDDPAIRLALARIERRLGLSEDARTTLDALDDAQSSQSLRLEVLDERSRIHADLGDVRAAAQLLERTVALEPSPDRLFQLAGYYRESGDLEHAIDCLRRSLDADQENPRYEAALGYTYLQAVRPAEAVEWLERAAKHDPRNLQIQQDLAYVLMRLGNPQGAAEVLGRAIDSESDAAESADAARQRTIVAMRGTLAQLERKYEGVAYFGYQTFVAPNTVSQGGALLASQGGFELSRSLSLAHPRWSVIGRLMATTDQPLSGVPARGAVQDVGIGVRYKPFEKENLNLSVERLMPVGSGDAGSWLLRGLFSREAGGGLQSDPGWHRYSLVYGDVAAFLGPYPSLLVFGEGRLGVSRNLNGSWVVRPHILAVAREQPAGAGGGEAFQFAAGFGLTYYFDQSPATAHRTSLETRVYQSSAFAGSGVSAGPRQTSGIEGVKGLTVSTSLRF